MMMNGSVIVDAGNQGTQIADINQGQTREVSFDAAHKRRRVSFPLRQFSNCVLTTATTSSSTGKYRLYKH